VRYLIDANVWLEAVTAAPRSPDVVSFLRSVPQGWLATTDFVLNTVGLILTPQSPVGFRTFLDDLIRLRVFTLHLAPSELYVVLDRMSSAGLDFDDAFQYVAAELNDLRIVSFDSDFDRTPLGRLTPSQAMSEIERPPTVEG
jgi:predicted nucleic acid-binding protein